MTASDRAFLAACAFVVGVAAAHALLGVYGPTLPCYFPVERLWRAAAPSAELSMCWYAATGASWLAGLACGGAAWAFARLAKRPADALTLHAFGWNALLFSLGMMALYFVAYRPW